MIPRTAHVRAAAAVAASPRRRPERDAVRAAHEVWIGMGALLVTGCTPAFQAQRSRSTAGDDGGSPAQSPTDQRPLSGSHARRLQALTPAAHLLVWKLETK
jgi:hypothetical protein